jgi:VWFA-related protein
MPPKMLSRRGRSGYRSHALAMCALVVCAVTLHAGQQQPAPRAVFKGQVTVIEVDVVAMRKSGELVRGLRQEDFEVFEDGAPVAIDSFVPVELPEVPLQPTTAPTNRSGSAFGSNDHPDAGRILLIVFDDVQFAFSARRLTMAKSVARRAVQKLGPADLAAVMTTSGATRADFGSDRDRLLEAIERFTPRGETAIPNASTSTAMGAGAPETRNRRPWEELKQALPETSAFSQIAPVAEERVRFIEERSTAAAMTGLAAASRALATIRNRRKSVLLISQGFPATHKDIIERPRLNSAMEAIRGFVATAMRNNVAVYTVDPCGFETDWGCTSDSRDNLRSIAEVTGGFATTNTDTPDAAVDRVVAEGGSYYLIGYPSPAPPNDGKRHTITVRTRVPGVEIRARAGYDSPRSEPTTANVKPIDALTRAMLPAPGLTMRVVAVPVPLSGDPGAAVVIGIDVAGAAAARAGRIEFAAVAIDQGGKSRASLRFTTDFSGTTPSALARTGSRLDLAPGRYDIRVAAVGADQSAGSVFTSVMVPDFRSDLAVGGLSIGTELGSRISERDRARGVLPLIPFAANEVAPGAAMAAQLPISVASKAASQPLAIVATLTAPDGTTHPLDRKVGVGQDFATRGGGVHKVVLPPTLPPGRHQLVLETTLGRTTVVRELTLTVLPPR